jgi:PEP-CTERM motif
MVESSASAKPSVEAASTGPASTEEEKMRKLVRTLVPCVLLMAAMPAHADELPFTGSVTGLSTFIGVDSTCVAPLQYRSKIDPASTVGTSPLGSFTLSTDTCLSLAGGLSAGTFIIDFGTDAFNGTFSGGSTPTSTPFVSDTDWLFTILGGTGRFEGATGSFEGLGTADATTRPTHVSINFDGIINAPAVPEPASWALMLLGFGGIGLVARRGRRVVEQLA